MLANNLGQARWMKQKGVEANNKTMRDKKDESRSATLAVCYVQVPTLQSWGGLRNRIGVREVERKREEEW
jgi:hypothetical protein